jgi:uncharacterized protein with von Willebrand factor type A (vWA) domain
MKERIINFIKLLRDSNIRISIAESIESCKALRLCDVYDREQFKLTLQTTLIKQVDDLPVFNKIFDLYFTEPFDDEVNEEISEQEFQSLIEQLQKEMQNQTFNQMAEDNQNPNSNSMPSDWVDNVEQYDKDKKNKDLLKQGSESDLREFAKQLANSRNFEDWETKDLNGT